MLPDAALGAALGMPFQQVPNANNNLLLSYLQQNAFQQQQQQQQGNPFLMSMLYQQQQMQQQQQQVRNVLCSEWKGASESIDSSTTVLRSTCMYQVTRRSSQPCFIFCLYLPYLIDNICPFFCNRPESAGSTSSPAASGRPGSVCCSGAGAAGAAAPGESGKSAGTAQSQRRLTTTAGSAGGCFCHAGRQQ